MQGPVFDPHHHNKEERERRRKIKEMKEEKTL